MFLGFKFVWVNLLLCRIENEIEKIVVIWKLKVKNLVKFKSFIIKSFFDVFFICLSKWLIFK